MITNLMLLIIVKKSIKLIDMDLKQRTERYGKETKFHYKKINLRIFIKMYPCIFRYNHYEKNFVLAIIN